MATHSANINNLRTATLGEQVRSSMIQLFEEDYNLVLKAVTIGTDITSASSSTAGYYDGNVYINSSTLDIWKLIGTVWTRQGNLKGISTFSEVPSTVDGGLNTITVTLTDGTTQTFTVKNGSKGANGDSVTGVVDNGDGTFYFTLSDGTSTGNIATIRGQQGIQGIQGVAGATGRGVTSITSTDTGKNHVLTANFTDGTSNVITTVKDGNDGAGTGDMQYITYDPTESGIVNSARAISDGTKTLTFNDVDSKANKATTLSGYGITDAYTKTETDTELAKKVDEPATDGSNGQALVTDGAGGRRWATVASSNYIESVTSDFTVTAKKLALATSVSAKLPTLAPTSSDVGFAPVVQSDLSVKWDEVKGGHDMITYSGTETVEDGIDKLVANTTADNVVDARIVKAYSNIYKDVIEVKAEVAKSAIGIGTWCEKDPSTDPWTLTDEADWLGSGTDPDDIKISNMIKTLEDDDIDIVFEFDPFYGKEPVYCGGYQIDTTNGRMCVKFGNTITNDAMIRISINHTRG